MELTTLAQFKAGIEFFREIDATMSIQTLHTFLLIAEQNPQGITVSELSDKLGLSVAAASRNIYILADFSVGMKKGLGLVTQAINPENRRERKAVLSRKGGEVYGLLRVKLITAAMDERDEQRKRKKRGGT